ncbi:MAG: FAD-binding oxidoreductase [Chloroflexi bacterium]|nr:FAD-binding oxidoreductase [Chloroflexota bacterium]
MALSSDAVICGAGIAGVATAYHLTRRGLKRVMIVDDRDPLTLTSDKSTECYRNWWPDASMVSFMDHSIDLIEGLARESGNVFHLNRRGYLYATADPARIPIFKAEAENAEAQGAGPLRVHPGPAAYTPAPPHGFEAQPTGADLILDPVLIRQHFPYLAENVVAVIHARRCGWFSGQQLGMTMLEQAKAGGVELVRGQVDGVTVESGRVKGVRLSDGREVGAEIFVNAAGPLIKNVGRMFGVELPVFSERHEKIAFKDHLNIIPRNMPFLIWADPQKIGWSDEERGLLAESEETTGLLGELPAGAHLRPEGGADANSVLMLWGYDTQPVPEVWPLEFDPMYYEVVLRGLATMMPGLTAYIGKAPKVEIDGGYYTKTRENRLLVGPLPVEGAFVIGALSGYGLMAAPAAGELLAAYLTGGGLPDYASAFALSRYDNPAYQKLLERWDEGQL